MANREDDKEQQGSNMFLIPDGQEDNVVVGDRETKVKFEICDVEEGDEKADTNEKKDDVDDDETANSPEVNFTHETPSRKADTNEEEEDDDDDDETAHLPKLDFSHETSSREYLFVLFLGLTMAFIAGYSNGVCLSGYLHVTKTMLRKQSVAGVTGIYTASAIALGKGDFNEYWFNVGTFLSVMVGACISSVMNPRPVAFELTPRYGPSFLIGSLFSMLGALESLHSTKREFYFTAIGNGIMNGISSMYTANLIRTTHLTGTTTDIGLFVGQFLRGNRSNLWKLYILAGLATSFWIGSLTGYEAAKFKGSHALIMNAAFFFAMGCSIITYFVCGPHKLSLLDAILGSGKFSIQFEKFTLQRQRVTSDDDNDNEGNKSTDNHDDRMSFVPENELLAIFDTLDANSDRRVDQDQLMDVLASKNIKIKKHRKPLLEILASVFDENRDVDGDWTIRRKDWQRLVRQQVKLESSRESSYGRRLSNHHSCDNVIDIDHSNNQANQSFRGRRSSRNSRTSVRQNYTNNAGNAIANLRRASIQEIEISGYHTKRY